MVSGNDGALVRTLLTDTEGRLITAPGTGSARANEAIGTANSSADFGPTGAVTSKWFTLSVTIWSYTASAAGNLTVELLDLSSGEPIAEVDVVIPSTIPTGGITVNVAGSLNFPHPGDASGAFEIAWSFVNAVVSALSGRISVVVGYH